MMRYWSICSGIEAASEAWKPLGWEPVLFSEIEPFPIAVLKYRHAAHDLRTPRPASAHVPLWGDFTALRLHHLRRFKIAWPSLIVGGTPCQAFSLAGKRLSLADHRGNLSLQFIRLVHAARRAGPLRWVVWENVPGVLSTRDNAFGCFLAGLVGADAPLDLPAGVGRWPDAGMVAGPLCRVAWRILDAQHFGVPQRRRRVFVVAGFGDGADPAAILFERAGMPGYFAASSEAGQDVAGTLGARSSGGGELGTNFDIAGGVIASTGDVSHCLNAGAMGRQDFETETLIAHTLRAEGFDASEDGTGRGIPLVPAYSIQAGALRNNLSSGPDGAGFNEEIAYTLEARSEVQAVASGRSGFGVGEIAPTLRAMGHADSHQNAGGQIAIAVSLRGREGGNTAELSGDIAPALRASQGGSDKPHVLTSAVRRLIPRECERLQGFRDNYTRIPLRWYRTIKITETRPVDRWEPDLGRGGYWLMSADGPRYKSLGNSMPVPVMRWIGQRIADFDKRAA